MWPCKSSLKLFDILSPTPFLHRLVDLGIVETGREGDGKIGRLVFGILVPAGAVVEWVEEKHTSGGGKLRYATCDDCVGACKKEQIYSSFWPSDSLENEILEAEV